MKNSLLAASMLLLSSCAHVEKKSAPLRSDPVMEGIQSIQAACRQKTAIYYSFDVLCKNQSGRVVEKQDGDKKTALTDGGAAPCRFAASLEKIYAGYSATCREFGGEPSIDFDLSSEIP